MQIKFLALATSITISLPALAGPIKPLVRTPRDKETKTESRAESNGQGHPRQTVAEQSQRLWQKVEELEMGGRHAPILNGRDPLLSAMPQITNGGNTAGGFPAPTWPSGRSMGLQGQLPLPPPNANGYAQLYSQQPHNQAAPAHTAEATVVKPSFPKSTDISQNELAQVMEDVSTQTSADPYFSGRVNAKSKNLQAVLESPQLMYKRLIIELENREGVTSQVLGTIRDIKSDISDDTVPKTVLISIEDSSGKTIETLEVETRSVVGLTSYQGIDSEGSLNRANTPEIESFRRVPAYVSKILGKKIIFSSSEAIILARNGETGKYILEIIGTGEIKIFDQSSISHYGVSKSK